MASRDIFHQYFRKAVDVSAILATPGTPPVEAKTPDLVPSTASAPVPQAT
jgi:hypothetical protein